MIIGGGGRSIGRIGRIGRPRREAVRSPAGRRRMDRLDPLCRPGRGPEFTIIIVSGNSNSISSISGNSEMIDSNSISSSSGGNSKVISSNSIGISSGGNSTMINSSSGPGSSATVAAVAGSCRSRRRSLQ